MWQGPNTIWVDKKYYPRFGIKDNSPEAMYKPTLIPAKKETITWGRNGVPWPPDKRYLTWENLKIEKKFRFDR